MVLSDTNIILETIIYNKGEADRRGKRRQSISLKMNLRLRLSLIIVGTWHSTYED